MVLKPQRAHRKIELTLSQNLCANDFEDLRRGKMKHLSILVVVLTCLLSGAASAIDADAEQNGREGLEALRAGDQEKFFEHALKDAEGGLAEAQLMVALQYEKGALGAPQSNSKALYWYERAAAQGQPEAEVHMAEICIQGKLKPRDLPASVDWLKKAASHGSAKANDYLGDSYLSGRGVEKNMKAAIPYYQKAANANVVGAQVKLGGFYLTGNGVPADVNESYFWLYIASKNPAKSPYKGLKEAAEGIRKKLSPEVALEVEKRADTLIASFP